MLSYLLFIIGGVILCFSGMVYLKVNPSMYYYLDKYGSVPDAVLSAHLVGVVGSTVGMIMVVVGFTINIFY